jgi:hypothetical protein
MVFSSGRKLIATEFICITIGDRFVIYLDLFICLGMELTSLCNYLMLATSAKYPRLQQGQEDSGAGTRGQGTENAMCTRLRDLPDGILVTSDRRMRAAHARWSRLTARDFSGIANKQDLITSVEERYNLSHAAAVQDVELWDAHVRGMFETTAGSLTRKESSP